MISQIMAASRPTIIGAPKLPTDDLSKELIARKLSAMNAHRHPHQRHLAPHLPTLPRTQ